MMEFYETLELIADFRDEHLGRYFDREAFAKEQGMKCDGVGWMRIDLKADFEKLRQISQAAKAKGVKLRGVYEKKAVDPSAEWYRFSPKNAFAISDISYAHKLGDYYYYKVKAYKAPRGCSIMGCSLMGQYVSQAFVDGCKELGLTGLDFIWTPDSGKYQAASFYSPIFLERAKRCIFPIRMQCLKKETYNYPSLEPVAGRYDFAAVKEYYRQADFPEGRLCEVEKYMDHLNAVLPLAVEYDSMPDADFAYCYLSGAGPISLIRADALEKMTAAGVVRREDFEPVTCTDAKEQNLLIRECDENREVGQMLKNKAHFEKLRLQLAAKERPEFVPSEKEVLALLKKYKKNHSEYLNRAISKTLAEKVENSSYRPLLPYYKVGCGGRLAEDTYEYFYYETAVERNNVWHEEYSDLLQDAVLFGKSCDDNYLMLHGEQVYEVSCHDHGIVKRWENLYLFFYEKLEG